MNDKHRVKFVRMKLQGSAKIYWMSVERQDARKNKIPIDTWATKKEQLAKKYLPFRPVV